MSTPSDPQRPDPGGFGRARPSDRLPSLDRIAPPPEVVLAYWIYVAVAAVSAAGALGLLVDRQASISAVREQASISGLHGTDVAAAANIAVWTVIVLALVLTALFGFFAVKLRRGRNWARVVLAVLAGLALFGLLGIGGANQSGLGLIAAIAPIVGAVLSYLPKSNAFFLAIRKTRFRPMP